MHSLRPTSASSRRSFATVRLRWPHAWRAAIPRGALSLPPAAADPVYYVRFKLSHSLVRGYRHLWRWLCDVYAVPGVAEASPLAHMKQVGERMGARGSQSALEAHTSHRTACPHHPRAQGYFGRTEAGLVPLGPPGYPELYTRPDAFFAEPAPPIGDLP